MVIVRAHGSASIPCERSHRVRARMQRGTPRIRATLTPRRGRVNRKATAAYRASTASREGCGRQPPDASKGAVRKAHRIPRLVAVGLATAALAAPAANARPVIDPPTDQGTGQIAIEPAPAPVVQSAD